MIRWYYYRSLCNLDEYVEVESPEFRTYNQYLLNKGCATFCRHAVPLFPLLSLPVPSYPPPVPVPLLSPILSPPVPLLTVPLLCPF